MEKTVGIASERLLPPFARQRFSTWFKKRSGPERRTVAEPQGKVAVFPTCLVEYQNPAIGQDLVKVYERNGIECSLPEGQVCCGAPWLHEGEVDKFVEQGRKNIRVLADAVRRGNDVVVPQPTCSYVLKKDYVDYIGGPDAELVAAHTYDAPSTSGSCTRARAPRSTPSSPARSPSRSPTTPPATCGPRTSGYRSRDLMKLAGHEDHPGRRVLRHRRHLGLPGAELREQPQGRQEDGRRHRGRRQRRRGRRLPPGQRRHPPGDRHASPLHPLQIVARAYGIPEEG